jgi:hypothetical protein
MTNTFTPEHRTKLEEYLSNHDLPKGLGTEENACSIAAINLAISGKLTDIIPDCMSAVLGRATIILQDAMPYEIRNSARYKKMLPDMAGTGRKHEQKRLAILMDWMWSVVLPQLQHLADEKGFGKEWRTMCELKTSSAANAAVNAVNYDARAARAARPAANAANAAYYAAATYAVSSAAHAAAYAADGAARAARAANADFWQTVNPIGVLERMTYLGGETE